MILFILSFQIIAHKCSFEHRYKKNDFNIHLFHVLIYNRHKRKDRFIIYKLYYQRENIIIITIFLLFESSNNLTCFITNNFFLETSFHDINLTTFKNTNS